MKTHVQLCLTCIQLFNGADVPVRAMKEYGE
jgi:hypothetical protein